FREDVIALVRKLNIVTAQGQKSLTNLVVDVILPCNIFQAFLTAAAKLEDAAFWPVARFVERIPLHGTEDAMIPATKLEPQARLLLEYLQTAKQPRLALLALAAAITHTGVRTLDLSDSFRKKSLDILKKHNAPEDWLQALQTDKVANSFMTDLRGDSLPLGLSFS
ncbi:MAG: hypothetical protein IKZ84_02725, partial [Victivallales bacterium]|nr:hypothetical protein [Victivallales bacterium]